MQCNWLLLIVNVSGFFSGVHLCRSFFFLLFLYSKTPSNGTLCFFFISQSTNSFSICCYDAYNCSMKNSTNESIPQPRTDVIWTDAVLSFIPPDTRRVSGRHSESFKRLECLMPRTIPKLSVEPNSYKEKSPKKCVFLYCSHQILFIWFFMKFKCSKYKSVFFFFSIMLDTYIWVCELSSSLYEWNGVFSFCTANHNFGSSQITPNIELMCTCIVV